jgi:hypothetical protein
MNNLSAKIGVSLYAFLDLSKKMDIYQPDTRRCGSIEPSAESLLTGPTCGLILGTECLSEVEVGRE